MKIVAESYGHSVILNVKGELDVDTLAAFEQAVDHQLENSEVVDLMFNLEEVPFIDSAGLEYLLALRRRIAERAGQIILAKPDENVRKILEITRLEANFEIFDDIPQAIQAINP